VLFHHTLSRSKQLTKTERTWQPQAVCWRPHMTTQAIWAPSSLVGTRWPWRKHLSMPRRFNLQPQGSDWYKPQVLPQLIHPTYETPYTRKHLTKKDEALPYPTPCRASYRYATCNAALCWTQLSTRWIETFYRQSSLLAGTRKEMVLYSVTRSQFVVEDTAAPHWIIRVSISIQFSTEYFESQQGLVNNN
jgi:hypothetical protein